MKNTIKKIMSIMLAAMMLVSVGVTAFAGTDGEKDFNPLMIYNSPLSGTPIGTEYEQVKYAVHEGRDSHYFGYDDSEYICSGIWKYKVLEDGTVSIRSIRGSEHKENVTIPSTIDGYTVSRVSLCGQDYYPLDNETPTLSITVPDTVTTIGDSAFDTNDLKRIVIPVSVKSISANAFEGNSNVEIYYEGTEEQWNDIIVWNYDSLGKYNWAVTDFNWLDLLWWEVYSDEIVPVIKTVYFNADSSTFEDLVWEEPSPKEPSILEQVLSGFTNIFATVVSFFKQIGDLIIQIF